MKSTLCTLILLGALVAGSATWLHAADAKAKYSIKDVMKALHKGDVNTAKTVSQGKGTKEDFAKLVEYYESLPLCTPPKGDKADWDSKATALLKAAKSLKAGESTALAAYKQASNCKACHSAHKPSN